MQTQTKKSAFTPLRIMLMILVTTANLGALTAFLGQDYPWSKMLGVFSTVFILMFVFLLLLELVWLHSMKKHMKDESLIKSYQWAINIYRVLFVIGFVLVYLVLA